MENILYFLYVKLDWIRYLHPNFHDDTTTSHEWYVY